MIFSLTAIIVTILLPIFLGILWIVIYCYFLKKRFAVVAFIPLAIVIIAALVLSQFLSKVYVIEPDTHCRVLLILGDYELHTPDKQKVQIKMSDKTSVTIINCTLFDLKLYGIPFGDISGMEMKPDLKIGAHTFSKLNTIPDVFPDQKIPNYLEVRNGSHGQVLNVLQFEDGEVLPY